MTMPRRASPAASMLICKAKGRIIGMPDVTIAGQSVVIDFDAILNTFDDDVDTGDRLVIELDAVLDADAGENLDGEVLANRVNLSLTAGGTALMDDDTADVSVVIPELALTNSRPIWNPTA